MLYHRCMSRFQEYVCVCVHASQQDNFELHVHDVTRQPLHTTHRCGSSLGEMQVSIFRTIRII